MRIRTIKPEFWRSDDVAGLPLRDRLLFIGLWSYVDDAGIGEDKLASICGDLFAPDLETDASETFARVREGLASLHDRGLIARYTVAGKQYLSIPTWSEHQRVDRPSKSRYPGPDQAGYESSTSPRRALDEPSMPEQGSRGTGEQGIPPSAAPAAAGDIPADLDPGDGTAQTLLTEWLDHCVKPPPGRVKGQVARELKTMLDDGVPYPDVRAGLAAWHDRRLHPATLPSVVHELRQGPAPPRPRPSTTDERVGAALALADRYRAAETGHPPPLRLIGDVS